MEFTNRGAHVAPSSSKAAGASPSRSPCELENPSGAHVAPPTGGQAPSSSKAAGASLTRKRVPGSPCACPRKGELENPSGVQASLHKEVERDYYSLPPGVRARKESFGLLFYNSKEGKLTFVRSGNLLDIRRDPEGGRRLVVNSADETAWEKAQRICRALAKKRLIDEPEIRP